MALDGRVGEWGRVREWVRVGEGERAKSNFSNKKTPMLYRIGVF